MFYVAKKFMPSKYQRNEYYQMRATEDGTYTPSSTIPLKAEQCWAEEFSILRSVFLVPAQHNWSFLRTSDGLHFPFPPPSPPPPNKSAFLFQLSCSYHFILGVIRADNLSFGL